MELVKTLQNKTEKVYSPFDVEKQQWTKLTVSGKLPINFFLSAVVANACSTSIFQWTETNGELKDGVTKIARFI